MSQGTKGRHSHFCSRGRLAGTLIQPLRTFGIKCKQAQTPSCKFSTIDGLASTHRIPDADDQSFVNKVSQSHQLDEPPEFCGGIVADPMGLGKTLTMIALAATDANVRDLPPSLIIVPPPREYTLPGSFYVDGPSLIIDTSA